MKKLFLVIIILISMVGCTYEKQDIKEESFQASDKIIKAYFLDVGQADANVVLLPNGEVMLIDAGVSSSSDKIISLLEDLGCNKIDYVVATHPHADHIGGMADVIETFRVGEIYMPKAVSTSKTYENLLLTIKDKGLKINTGKKGVEILNEDNLKIDIVAPNKQDYSNLNNFSIVLKITYGNISFLYTGDAEKDSLEEITSDIKANILKVGHHGSDTSTYKEFLDKVKPQYAIISVGEGNSYGHPDNKVLNLLGDYKVKTYRTDVNGDVLITSNGDNIKVETER